MTGSILFVCAANVCRSPLMHYTFLGTAGHPDWSVSSAGVSARTGARMCEIARSEVRDPRSKSLAEQHHSALVDEAAIQSDLVIVASRAERAVLAKRDPELRSRVFTLPEAVLLGRIVAAERNGATDFDASISDYAQSLDAQRGMLVFPRPQREHRWFGAAASSHPLDIPDDHHRRRGPHRATLKRVRLETEEFTAQLLAATGSGE
ncbi:protein-tyrosine-phosphatase [Leucobacter sp. Psy1]|uniref:arsenate reductase/protein-tyrosine-phosphatase family protein n=1 Tax=Leucobacter sp. Psy1 TaxID=2875729 RepID=UPI001CD7C5B7|nr:hypothetical protein [Leucobacter sp. Psy1]UBH07487.1 protein-tyrosine-phosphatase [Leucobacter sp. Psy1]